MPPLSSPGERSLSTWHGSEKFSGRNVNDTWRLKFKFVWLVECASLYTSLEEFRWIVVSTTPSYNPTSLPVHGIDRRPCLDQAGGAWLGQPLREPWGESWGPLAALHGPSSCCMDHGAAAWTTELLHGSGRACMVQLDNPLPCTWGGGRGQHPQYNSLMHYGVVPLHR